MVIYLRNISEASYVSCADCPYNSNAGVANFRPAGYGVATLLAPLWEEFEEASK